MAQWLNAHGSCPKARGSRLMAKKNLRWVSQARALAPHCSWLWAMTHEPPATSLVAWAMSHEPWATNHQPLIIDALRNYSVRSFKVSKFSSFKVSKSQSSKVSRLQSFEIPHFPKFKFSKFLGAHSFQYFRCLKLWDFQNKSCWTWVGSLLGFRKATLRKLRKPKSWHLQKSPKSENSIN